MTIQEAARQGLGRIRLPEWHAKAYLRLFLCGEGLMGPWVECFDRPGALATGQELPMSFFAGEISGDTWEPYLGAPDSAEVDTQDETEDREV